MQELQIVLNEGLRPLSYVSGGEILNVKGNKLVNGYRVGKSLYCNDVRLIGNDGRVLKLPVVIFKGNKTSNVINSPLMLLRRQVDSNGTVLGYLVDLGGYKQKMSIMDIVILSEVVNTGNYYVSQKAGKHYLVSKPGGVKLSDLPADVVVSSGSDLGATGKERQTGVHIGDNKDRNKDIKVSIFDLCARLVEVNGVLVRVKGSKYKTIGERTSDTGDRFISKGIEIARPYLTPSHKGLNVNLSFKQLGSLNVKDVISGVSVVDSYIYKTRALVTGDVYNFANDEKSDLYVGITEDKVGSLHQRVKGTGLELALESCDNVLIGSTLQAEGYLDGNVKVYGLNTRVLTGIEASKGLDNSRLFSNVRLRSDLAYIRKKLKAELKGYEKEDKDNSYGGLVYAAHLEKYGIDTLQRLQELGMDLKTGAYTVVNSYAKAGKEAVEADIKGISSLEWGYKGVLTDKTSLANEYRGLVVDILRGVREFEDLSVLGSSLDGSGLGKTVLQTFGVMDAITCLGVYDRVDNRVTDTIKRLLNMVGKDRIGLDYVDMHKVIYTNVGMSGKVSDLYLGVVLGLVDFLVSKRYTLDGVCAVLKGAIKGLDTAITILDYSLCKANVYISKQENYFSEGWSDITSARQKAGKKYGKEDITVIVK